MVLYLLLLNVVRFIPIIIFYFHAYIGLDVCNSVMEINNLKTKYYYFNVLPFASFSFSARFSKSLNMAFPTLLQLTCFSTRSYDTVLILWNN